MRNATVKRKTNETDITIRVELEGGGRAVIDTEMGFFAHMLETLARFGGFDLEAEIRGDRRVDDHHGVEDTGIVLGEALRRALGERHGIARNGFCLFPMDESLALAAVDLSNRACVCFNGGFAGPRAGDFELGLLDDFFTALAANLGAALHLQVLCGRSDHHRAEALFKALGRALRQAWRVETGAGDVPSCKGVL